MNTIYLKSLVMVFALFASASMFSQGATCEEAVAVAAGDYIEPALIGGGASNICYGAGGTNASWYTYTATADVAVVVSSNDDPNTIDTRLSIYTGTCDDLTCLTFNDDGGVGFTSIASFNATTGTTYYIEWDDRWDDAGFEWELIEYVTTPDCAVQVFPADGAVDVVLDEDNLNSVILTWDLPTGGDEFLNVVVSGGTDPSALNVIANLDATATSYQWNFLGFAETYYWTVVPTAFGGVASDPCTMFSFTAAFMEGDSDGDGVLDVDDCAPNDILVYEGALCDDGNAGTVNDQIQEDCVCSGLVPSVGDICEIAEEAFIGVNVVDSVGNGIEGASNVCFGTGGTDAHWYFWEAPNFGEVTISSSIDPDLTDTRLSVYTGTCDDLTCFASNDDGGEGFTSIVVELVDSGTVFLIEWDDRWSSNGFDFEIQFLDGADDADLDGIVDLLDNCVDIANPDQADLDGDGIGDVCDDNIDGDSDLNDVDCDPLDAAVFIGAACDDGIPATVSDALGEDCVCLGLVPSPGDICEIADEAFVGINTCDTVSNGIGGASNLCFGTGAEDAHWYFWEAPSDGQVTINSGVDPNLNDTRLSVYTGACDALVCFASSDDEGDGFTSIITAPVTGGETYFIEWDDRWNGNGFDFEIVFLSNTVDTDEDGVVDIEDNCPDTPNTDQADLDGDGLGDVCDDDIDGDFFLNDDDCDPVDATVFAGAVCDDGDAETVNDIIQADCTCAGVIPPTNTECGESIVVTVGSYVDPGPFAGGNAANNCFATGGTNSNWYEYTAEGWGTVTVGSDLDPDLPDTRLSVYTGTCDDLTCFASSDDDGAGFTSVVSFPVENGVAYFIEWDDRWNDDSFDWYIDFLTGIEDIEATDSGVTVYPNPTNDMLNLTYTLDQSTVVLYEVYNISGQMILTESVSEAQGVVRQSIDVNDLSSGMYVLRILVDDQQVMKRFDIQK